jgi:hypothetical protein
MNSATLPSPPVLQIQIGLQLLTWWLRMEAITGSQRILAVYAMQDTTMATQQLHAL